MSTVELDPDYDQSFKFIPRSGAVSSRLRPWCGLTITINGWYPRFETVSEGVHKITMFGYCVEAGAVIDLRDLFPIIPPKDQQV